MKKFKVVRSLIETGEVEANSLDHAYEIADAQAIEDIKFIAQPFGFQVSQIKFDITEKDS